MSEDREMGFIRRNFFPVKNKELEKFFWLSSLICLISFSYAVLRVMKECYIIPLGGSETISSLKLFGVLPSAYLAKYVFDYISQRSSIRYRFNFVIGYFILFIFIFKFSLPWHDLVKPTNIALFLQDKFPKLSHIVVIFSEWPSSLFYIQTELFGVFVLSVLFFSLANRVTTLKQASYFYGLFAVAANIGSIFAGRLLGGKIMGRLSDGQLLFFVVFALISLIVLNTLFCRAMDKNPEKFDIKNQEKKNIPKLSFTQSLSLLRKNRYLWLIAALVLIYGISINLFEAIYKDWLYKMSKEAAPEIIKQYASEGILISLKEATSEYIKKYKSLQMEYIGIFSTLAVLFIVIPSRKLGWRAMGLFTPIIQLISVIVFAYAIFFQRNIEFLSQILSTNSKEFTLIVGLVSLIAIKSIKYTFFDPHKEKAYIPLDPQTKLLGKSGIEPFSRIGKASGAVIVNIAGILGGVEMFRGTFFLILIVLTLLWILVVDEMSKEFKKLKNNK